MAKLVDALCSGRSAGNGVLVRIQFWAQRPADFIGWSFLFDYEPGAACVSGE
jgi:hypothetical protein